VYPSEHPELKVVATACRRRPVPPPPAAEPSPPPQAWGKGHAIITVEYGLTRQYPGATAMVLPAQPAVPAGHGVHVVAIGS
jgi:hypothetical protein